MKHVPHLVVTAPWQGPRLDLSSVQWRHVTKVLRMQSGEAVTYTNGLGIIGSGVLINQGIERGVEVEVERPTSLTMAVAPPASKDRQRFLVEKLTELGVARLIWLETKHGRDRLASASKVVGWMHAALEQSRGAYLMETSDELLGLGDLEGRVVVCMPGGDTEADDFDVIAIGPEGGFAEDELPENARLWDLGPTVLRVETAAIVAAARQTSF